MRRGMTIHGIGRGKGFVGKQGFTLLEILIAVATLTVGFLAVGAIQISSIRGNATSANTSIALALASDKMEDLLNRGLNDPILTDRTRANDGNLASISTVDFEERLNEQGQVTAGGFYRRIVNVADNTPVATLKTIAVIVTWENNKHRVALSCIKSPS
jgi:prepilin-type N-terminal cleavage/methylation domain-containing protein